MKTIKHKTGLDEIKQFMANKNMAVVGVSRDSKKFGNALVKELKTKEYNLYPVHPEMETAEDVKCYPSVEALPDEVTAMIISTKPERTTEIVKQAIARGIKQIFLQQGSQNDEAVNYALENGANIIQRRCALMFAEPVGSIHKFHRTLSKLFGAYPK